MFELLSVCITLFAIWYFLLPLFNNKKIASSENIFIDEEWKRTVILKNISELDMDYETGKISKIDYDVMKTEYERELKKISRKLE